MIAKPLHGICTRDLAVATNARVTRATRLLVLTVCGLSLASCATSRAPAQASVPNYAAAIVAAVIAVVPDQAPAIAVAGIAAAPNQAEAITWAAVGAAPDQMTAITAAAVAAAPRQAAAIRRAAAAAMESGEGSASPALAPTSIDRSDFARSFMRGDPVIFRDTVR